MRFIVFVAILLLSSAVPLYAQGKQTVAEMIEQLKKGDAEKLKALEVLESMGEKASDAAGPVVELLALKNEDVRLQAAMTLGKIGAAGVAPLSKLLDGYYVSTANPKKVEMLIKKLGSSNFAERDVARKELEGMGFHVLGALKLAIKSNVDLETTRRAEEIVKHIESTTGTRFYTVWSLAFIGPAAKSATPMVVKALGDPSADVRRKAAYTLGRIDADPENVVDVLVKALGDSDADVRQTAADALPKMSKAAVPVLRKALQAQTPELRNAAMQILGKIGPDAAEAIPDLKVFLIDRRGAPSLAADALAGIGPAALPALTEAVNSEHIAVREWTIPALHKMGAPAVPIFVDLLGSKYVDVQRQAAALLGGMQVHDKSVVIALSYATKDKDTQVRASALNSLRQMRSKFSEPFVIALLTDLDPNLRLNAFHTLRELGIDPQPGLKKALANPDATTRITTASLMAQLNFEVQLAEPILVEALKEKNNDLKLQAAHALSLRGLREDEVLPIFLAGLKSQTASVRSQAIESIARYGAKAKSAGPAIISALDDPDDSVCGQAMAALKVVGAEPRALFPAMVKVLRRPDTKLHQAASQIIFQVGPTAIDEVITLLKKEDAPGVRLACLQTLAMVGPPAKDAVPDLIKALEDTAPRARMTAARALGNIGPAAKSAEDALKKAEKDADANVQQIAKAALVQINADANAKDFQVQGVLTPGDPFDRVRQGHFHVVHTYLMKKGQRYQIDLTSQWDNYLRLENARGDQLAQDDDGGGYPNARIIFAAPEDGWYRIIVTTYSGGTSGAYTLRVK